MRLSSKFAKSLERPKDDARPTLWVHLSRFPHTILFQKYTNKGYTEANETKKVRSFNCGDIQFEKMPLFRPHNSISIAV